MFGVDLGSMHIRIYNRHTKTVEKTKTALTIQNRNQIYAMGENAFAMYEKVPSNMEVVFPVVNGVIADYRYMQMLTTSFLNSIAKGRTRGADFIIAVPVDITEVEKKAFFDLLYKSKGKPKNVLLCDKPVADCAGLGLDVAGALGIFIVDVGYQTTEISVVSLGGIVNSELLPFGGGRMDDAIIAALRRNHNLLIGRRTAMQLKETYACAQVDEDDKTTVSVVGMNVVSGLPQTLEIEVQEINAALQDTLNAISASVKRILERTPPELAKDIVRDGIYLAGGGSALKGFDQLISETAGIPVNTCEQPDECAARGLGTIITTPAFHKLAYSMKTKVLK